jgi:hypothetical protein
MTAMAVGLAMAPAEAIMVRRLEPSLLIDSIWKKILYHIFIADYGKHCKMSL